MENEHSFLHNCKHEKLLYFVFPGGLGMNATQLARAAELIGSTDLALSVTLGAHQVRQRILLDMLLYCTVLHSAFSLKLYTTTVHDMYSTVQYCLAQICELHRIELI